VVLAASSALAQRDITFTSVHALPSNQVELMWSSDTNRWYAIERTANLTNWNNEFDFVIPDDTAPIESNHWTLITDTNPCFFRLFASAPVGPQDNCYTNMGTTGDDNQVVIGTTNMDYVLQFGDGSNDTQYASVGANDDWIAQYGGIGGDTQTARAGTADDWVFQDGGPGNDTSYVDGGDENDWMVQHGGEGDDQLDMFFGTGDDRVWQDGGDGSDDMEVLTGPGDEQIVMRGGNGNDALTYDASDGSDEATIDGGSDNDVLTVNYTIQSLAIRLPDGTDLYTSGIPGTVITVISLETIYAVDTNGTNWVGSAP